MTHVSDKPSMSERYVSATNSRNLALNPESRTDADILLAASYAALRFRDGALGLDFYRLKANNDFSGFRRLTGVVAKLLASRSRHKGRNALSMPQAHDLAAKTLFWWVTPTCQACDGHGHPTIPNSPVIDTSRSCGACRGTGNVPIEQVVPFGRSDDAAWLVSEINRMCAIVFSDMVKLVKLDL